MKIKDIHLYKIYHKSILVEIICDDGTKGLGQFIAFSEKSQVYYFEEVLKPFLLCKQIEDIKDTWHDLYWRCQGKNGWIQVIAAIDIALHDIEGKLNQQPIWKRLGGKKAQEIHLYWSMGHGHKKTNKEMIKLMQKGLDLGFTAFKIRMDWHEYNLDADLEKDISMAKEVKNFLGDEFPLGFDANGGYSSKSAIEQSKKLNDLGITHFEEPVSTNDLFSLKEVVKVSDVPISFGEYEKTFNRFKEIVEITNLEILQPDVSNIGGISEQHKVFQYSQEKEKKVLPHSPDVGILSFASLHIFNNYNLNELHEYSDELCNRDHNIVQDFFNENVLPKSGKIKLSDMPGLGLTIREDKRKDLKKIS